MILPGKHLKQERSLLGVGNEILATIKGGDTVSELWERVQEARSAHASPLSFDWFILSLSFLYAIDAIGYNQGILSVGRDI
jgi:hypothetical protein